MITLHVRWRNATLNKTHNDHDVEHMYRIMTQNDVDGSVQDCGISSANALEIPQSCTKPYQYASQIAHIYGSNLKLMKVFLAMVVQLSLENVSKICM